MDINIMIKSIHFITCFLLIKSLSFSQSIKSNINIQSDNILTAVVDKVEFMSRIYLGNDVYILCKTNDSLCVTSYTATENDKINYVYSISVNDDTLFTSAIERLSRVVRQAHQYQPYSRNALANKNFLLAFKANNGIVIFYQEMATRSELEDIKLIVESLNIYTIEPFGKPNPRIRELNIKDWKGLLNYFKVHFATRNGFR